MKLISCRRSLLYANILFIWIFTSCNNSHTGYEQKLAVEQNKNKFTNSAEDDAKFVAEATELNLKEIQLAKLAQKNGTGKDVTELAKMLERDHTQALNEIKGMAGRKSISVPDAPGSEAEEAYTKLSGKTGKDFDMEYCDMMVKGHENGIKKFEKAASDAHDSEVRSWAEGMLPKLRAHLVHAKLCVEKSKNM